MSADVPRIPRYALPHYVETPEQRERLSSIDSMRSRSGERGWVKTKNRDYRWYEMEREGAAKRRRERQFV